MNVIFLLEFYVFFYVFFLCIILSRVLIFSTKSLCSEKIYSWNQFSYSWFFLESLQWLTMCKVFLKVISATMSFSGQNCYKHSLLSFPFPRPHLPIKFSSIPCPILAWKWLIIFISVLFFHFFILSFGRLDCRGEKLSKVFLCPIWVWSVSLL